MDISIKCIYCITKKADTLFDQHMPKQKSKMDYMKGVYRIISETDNNDTSPHLTARVMRHLNSHCNIDEYYKKIKDNSNLLMLSLEDGVNEQIHKSNDKLHSALKYAMVGNFIDFGAMDHVDPQKLESLIRDASHQEIDKSEYEKFVEDLKKAKRLTYITDNAGEIVFDKIFIKEIQAEFPDLKIEVIVRGKPVYNDATITDAMDVGLCAIVDAIENGTDIPGTQLDKINEASKKSIEEADLIISKGQGNFETLCGCKKNIYYIFLCKCELFTKRFNLQQFKGVFANEKRVKNLMLNAKAGLSQSI